jgi:hypothetical protein
MAELILAAPGSSARLSLTLPKPISSLFPQALIYNASDALVATVNLGATAPAGRYTGVFSVPSTPGKFTVHYNTFTDAGRTTLSKRFGADQDVVISDFAVALAPDVWNVLTTAAGTAGTYGEAVKLLLGSIGKANYRIDNMVYDTNGFLQAARIRVFPNAVIAAASTSGGTGEGELYTIAISGTPSFSFPNLPSTVLGLF